MQPVLDAIILCAVGHLPSLQIPIGNSCIKIQALIFFFFFLDFISPRKPATLLFPLCPLQWWERCESCECLFGLSLWHDQSLALTRHLGQCLIPGTCRSNSLALVGEGWIWVLGNTAEELWELDLFGSLPWVAAPSPAFSAATAQHRRLPSAPWQSCLAGLWVSYSM